jgi:CheY-like chemotaxis protein
MSDQALILLVEDDDNSVFLLRHALAKAGVSSSLQVLGTGEDAIAYLAGTERFSDWHKFPLPSIVLLDLKLPGISGFEVLKFIRQHPGLKPLRVAMLTSSDLDQDIKTAYELGANIFLTKPVQLEKLIEMMKMLHGHWLQQAQAATVTREK